MLAGVILSIGGRYDEDIRFSLENLLNGALFTNGAGLMYLGTLGLIITPIAVLALLFIYYLFSDTRKYSVYCLLIILVLIIVVLMRV